MKKETIIAIILGVIIGGGVAFSLITKTKEKQIEETKTVSNVNQNKPTISIINNNLQTLEITKPPATFISEKKTITIKGKASKNALIVIQSPIKQIVFKNKNKDFSVDFPLVLGENIIKVTVYPKNPQLRIQQKELKVYYLGK